MRNKIMKRFLSVALIVAALTTVAFAASSVSDSYTGDKNFSPNSGTLKATFYSDEIITRLTGTYSSSRVSAIEDYNDFPELPRYAGLDIKAVPLGDGEYLDAYSISTNIPHPKKDMESSLNYPDVYDEEAEVVCQGGLVANTSYYMSVVWDDFRSASTDSNGRFSANAELSRPGVSDYNVSDYDHLTSIDFGNTQGEP